jgi:dolichyl-phosphate beta-glucosyltransferase
VLTAPGRPGGRVDFSVVVPCYNEAPRLRPTLERLRLHLDGLGRPYEVIFVDDGSKDSTLICLREATGCWPEAEIVALRVNAGKGRAVASGIRGSRGDVVLYSDADLSTPIEELDKLERALRRGVDVAFGSRSVAGAEPVARQLYRRVMGRLFNVVVRALLLPGFGDTQCGFKALRGEVARELFADLVTDGFAFDVEILWKAKCAGLRLEEVSVRWRDSGGTRVAPVRHSLQMLRDVLALTARRALMRVPQSPGHDPAVNG